MNPIEQQLLNQLIVSERQKQDALILSALQAHIPELTMANFGQYADRIVQTTEDNKPYPIRIYLDYGTPEQLLVCEIPEPAKPSVK